MDFRTVSIRRLVPQRPPFLFVDRVVECDGTDALTEYAVAGGHLLVCDGRLTAPGIIENMAQSCAARMGCVDVMHGEPVKVGYIGEVRRAEILSLPRTGQTLRTRVHIVEEVFNVLLAEVAVAVDDETVATAQMKVAKTDIVADLSE